MYVAVSVGAKVTPGSATRNMRIVVVSTLLLGLAVVANPAKNQGDAQRPVLVRQPADLPVLSAAAPRGTFTLRPGQAPVLLIKGERFAPAH